MSVKKHANLDLKQTKWLKEGRGFGHGNDYRPWLTVRDVASTGRSHRIFGHTSGRHTIFSLTWSWRFSWSWSGTKHPALQGHDYIMTTDFLVDTHSASQPKFAIQAKYAKDLQETRVVEKLELERRYWRQKSIPWYIVTEQEISKTVFDNIKHLHPAGRDTLSEAEVADRLAFYSPHLLTKGNLTLTEFSQKIDTAYALEPGQCLSEFRQLLAQRLLIFDITIPFRKLKLSDMKPGDTGPIQEKRHVSNQ
jgi:TnsA endonuclease N terminal/TnsA endonuclease C terminal